MSQTVDKRSFELALKLLMEFRKVVLDANCDPMAVRQALLLVLSIDKIHGIESIGKEKLAEFDRLCEIENVRLIQKIIQDLT